MFDKMVKKIYTSFKEQILNIPSDKKNNSLIFLLTFDYDKKKKVSSLIDAKSSFWKK